MSFETVLFSWCPLGKVQRVNWGFPFDIIFPSFLLYILVLTSSTEVAAKITLLLPRGREMYAGPGEAVMDMAWTHGMDPLFCPSRSMRPIRASLVSVQAGSTFSYLLQIDVLN